MAKFYILGAGTPTPTYSRFGTSYILQIDKEFLMFDCGPATTYKLVKTGIFPTQIDYLFITHHHFDHTADYPCFILCRWEQFIGKGNQLKVYGPSPTVQITKSLFGEEGAFSYDWKARVNAPVSQHVYVNRGGILPRPKLHVDVQDIKHGDVIENENWRITTALAHHVEPWLSSLAYRVDSKEGTIVFAGDTGPCESVDKLAYGTNVLVVNCWDHQDTMEKNGESLGQTGTIDAANFAKKSKAETLILTHMGTNLTTPSSKEKAIKDIIKIYSGHIVFAEEMMVISLFS